MSWRTVVIDSHSKLSYKNGYLIVRSDKVNMIHLSEINILIINSTAVTVTSYLINELLKEKIKVIFCDEKRNPAGEVISYYGCHNSSKRIIEQLNWNTANTIQVWTRIIEEKIRNQARTLQKYQLDTSIKLNGYIAELKQNDITNREGHAAKVYFDSMFGMEFNRENDNDINSALNYGYSVILSQFNKEIVSYGCITQLGIKHRNEYNPFNLSSDLMEPFRPLVDCVVKDNVGEPFNGALKVKLINVLNQKVIIKGRMHYVSNAISIYVKSVLSSLNTGNIAEICFFEYET